MLVRNLFVTAIATLIVAPPFAQECASERAAINGALDQLNKGQMVQAIETLAKASTEPVQAATPICDINVSAGKMSFAFNGQNISAGMNEETIYKLISYVRTGQCVASAACSVKTVNVDSTFGSGTFEDAHTQNMLIINGAIVINYGSCHDKPGSLVDKIGYCDGGDPRAAVMKLQSDLNAAGVCRQ